MSEKRDDDGTAYTKYTMNYTNTGTGYSYPNLGYFYYPYVSGHTYRVSYDVRVNTSSGFGYSLMRHAGFRNNWEATANDIKNVTDGWKHKIIERTFTGTKIFLMEKLYKNGTRFQKWDQDQRNSIRGVRMFLQINRFFDIIKRKIRLWEV